MDVQYAHLFRVYSTFILVTITLAKIVFHGKPFSRHLPYGITQSYLPPDTSERAPP